MTIEVTQEDIDEGICGDPYRCPVAVALKRISGEKSMVGIGWATVGKMGFVIPADVRAKISLFDASGKMNPFTFNVERMYNVTTDV